MMKTIKLTSGHLILNYKDKVVDDKERISKSTLNSIIIYQNDFKNNNKSIKIVFGESDILELKKLFRELED